MSETTENKVYANIEVIDGQIHIKTNLPPLGAIHLLSSAQMTVVEQTMDKEENKEEE